MTKFEFLEELRNGLNGLPKNEIEERISFYSEIIDDLVEEGSSINEAISSLGAVDAIVCEILKDYPLTKLVKEKIKPKRKLATWELVLLIIGSPIWGSLLIALIACILSIYVSIWSAIIALWASFAAVAGSFLGFMLFGIISLCLGNSYSGITMIALSFIADGVSIFFFYGCLYATKGLLLLTKKILIWIKKCFLKKGDK